MPKKDVKVFLISMDKKLIQEVEKEAKKDFMSRNAFINALIRNHIKEKKEPQ